MEIRMAVTKTPKYAVSDSGDSVEIVERPKGGLTAILADGQGSGTFARITSNLVVSKAASLISEGARDGAVARAVHDYLYAIKNGKVSSTLTIISVDLDTKSIVVSRNSNCPVIIKKRNDIKILDEYVESIGFHKLMKPSITEFALAEDLVIVSFSDGILSAGKKTGLMMTVENIVDLVRESCPEEIDSLAETILESAIKMDKGKPSDDMTVVTVGICPYYDQKKIRRMRVSLPF
jgi:serine phosphatase RsbU (regulator of sigma subunit)